MEVSTKRMKNCSVIEVSGRIDSATAPQLAGALKALTDDGIFKIVLDMNGVEFTSSAGMRVMIDVQKKCNQFGRGDLVLAAVPQRVMEALELGGFDMIFRFFDTPVEAVGSFV
ncbi:MAG: STAS domain-containing protein [Anaerolineae bacterium]|nr:STAS domain-containing protein [Anaerolineae bacterium]